MASLLLQGGPHSQGGLGGGRVTGKVHGGVGRREQPLTASDPHTGEAQRQEKPRQGRGRGLKVREWSRWSRPRVSSRIPWRDARLPLPPCRKGNRGRRGPAGGRGSSESITHSRVLQERPRPQPQLTDPATTRSSTPAGFRADCADSLGTVGQRGRPGAARRSPVPTPSTASSSPRALSQESSSSPQREPKW